MIAKLLDGKIAFYHAPKCGSRTVVAWAVLMEDPELFKREPELFIPSSRKEYREIRNRVHVFPESKNDWRDSETIPKVDATIRFCIVRDPVERFVSAFTNRVLFHRNYQNGQIELSEFIDCFNEICIENEYINLHFLPQTAYYGKDPAVFTHIFSMNHMDAVKTFLEEQAAISLPRLQLQQSGSITSPSISTQQKAWIKNRFAKDYEVFGSFF